MNWFQSTKAKFIFVCFFLFLALLVYLCIWYFNLLKIFQIFNCPLCYFWFTTFTTLILYKFNKYKTDNVFIYLFFYFFVFVFFVISISIIVKYYYVIDSIWWDKIFNGFTFSFIFSIITKIYK